MKFNRYGSAAIIAVAGTVLLSACAANEPAATAPSGSASASVSNLTGTLIGAGSSAQQSAQEAWIKAFQTANPNVTVQYDPIGSGGGRDTFTGGGSAFAGSDRAFKDSEIAADKFGACKPGTGIVEIPAYISPIAVVFNLAGVKTLNLDAPTIAGIFKGTITTWNDPAIASQNSGATLPAQAITAVHRADNSGTTENFTDYLNAAAPAVWDAKPSGDWPFPGGEAAPQTSGVVDAVTKGTGTIGYVDASRAGSLGTVAVKIGNEYVPFSAKAAAAIVDASPLATGRTPGDLAIKIDRKSSTAGVYPVVLVSYLIACNQYADPKSVDLVKAYFNYVISAEGQATGAKAAGIAPISTTLFDKASAAVKAIK